METRCINPQCEDRSRYFGAGALYVLEKRGVGRLPRHTEYFWLCASCVDRFMVETDAGGNVAVVPQSRTAGLMGSNANSLRLVFCSKGITLPVNSIKRHSAASHAFSPKIIGQNGGAAVAESFGQR